MKKRSFQQTMRFTPFTRSHPRDVYIAEELAVLTAFYSWCLCRLLEIGQEWNRFACSLACNTSAFIQRRGILTLLNKNSMQNGYVLVNKLLFSSGQLFRRIQCKILNINSPFVCTFSHWPILVFFGSVIIIFLI